MKKWNNWIWGFAVLAVLAAAFFLPRLILSAQQKNAMYQVKTLAVEDQFSEAGDLDAVEKLQLLCDDTAETVYLSSTSFDLSAISAEFNEQLDRLIELGAITSTIVAPQEGDLAREIVGVHQGIVMRTDKIMRFYEIHTESLFAIMDMDTGKVYYLETRTQTEYGMEKAYITMTMSETDRMRSGAVAELVGWANYFDLTLDDITFDNLELSDADGNWNLVSCFFSDSSGNTVGFTLSHNYARYSIGWRSIDLELTTSIRDTIKEAEVTAEG